MTPDQILRDLISNIHAARAFNADHKHDPTMRELYDHMVGAAVSLAEAQRHVTQRTALPRES